MKTIKLAILLVLVFNQFAISQNSWFQQSSNTALHLNKVKFVNNSTGFAIGDSSKILRTTNSGFKWISSDIPPSGHQMRAIHFLNESTGWIAGGHYEYYLLHAGVVFYTTNAGSNWVLRGGGDCHSIFFIDENTGYKGLDESGDFASSGIISKTTNGGLNWFLQSIYISDYITTDIVFINAMTGWACGYSWSDVSIYDSSIVSKTTDGGETWIMKLTVPTPEYDTFFRELFFINNTLWVTGKDNIIYQSSDEGEIWTADTIGSNRSFRSLFFINSNTGWLCGSRAPDTSNFMKTTDGGNNWFSIKSVNAPYLLNSVNFVNELTGWSIGVNGIICKTITGGLTDISYNQTQLTESFILKQNYPNPFNPFTTIKFTIDKPSSVKLSVYGINGKLMKTLLNSYLHAQSYEINFDGTHLSSGLYLYRLESETTTETKTMVLIK